MIPGIQYIYLWRRWDYVETTAVHVSREKGEKNANIGASILKKLVLKLSNIQYRYFDTNFDKSIIISVL